MEIHILEPKALVLGHASLVHAPEQRLSKLSTCGIVSCLKCQQFINSEGSIITTSHEKSFSHNHVWKRSKNLQNILDRIDQCWITTLPPLSPVNIYAGKISIEACMYYWLSHSHKYKHCWRIDSFSWSRPHRMIFMLPEREASNYIMQIQDFASSMYVKTGSAKDCWSIRTFI